LRRGRAPARGLGEASPRGSSRAGALTHAARHVRCSGTGVMELREGLELSSRLRVVRLLARGGMATLWLADHRTLGIPVVVKVLTPAAAREATATRRLAREARLMAKVAGPHVVRVLDCDEG